MDVLHELIVPNTNTSTSPWLSNGVGVDVGSGVRVGHGVDVGLGVAVGLGAAVGVGLGVGVGVSVGLGTAGATPGGRLHPPPDILTRIVWAESSFGNTCPVRESTFQLP